MQRHNGKLRIPNSNTAHHYTLKKFFNQMFTYIEKAYKNEILDLKLTLCAKIDPYLSK